MRLGVVVFIVAMFFMPMIAEAQSSQLLSVDLAEKSIDITTGFDGGRLTLYGTAKEHGDIAVTVQGPLNSMAVRRKSRILGIWMNRKSIEFEHVPAYYDFALSRAAEDMGSHEFMRRNDIGLDAFHFDTRSSHVDPVMADMFREALVRNLQAQGLFPLEPKAVSFLDDHFFRVVFILPSNMPTGLYRVSTFLIRNGDMLDKNVMEIRAAQTGFSADISLFAQNQSFAYGVMAVLMALFFGWGAYVILRRE